MFPLRSLAIFSTIAFSTPTSAIPPTTLVGDLPISDVPVATSLGSLQASPGLATVFTDLKICYADPAAAALQSGAADNARVTTVNEMQVCISDAVRPVQALRNQSTMAVLAALRGTDPALATAEDLNELFYGILKVSDQLIMNSRLADEAADIVTDVDHTISDSQESDSRR
ncbi:hypothetical protein K466DRAFT_602681 [Polyporus arcularius HHB13444]|uniref:Uncharacterized protein n=1 Tax=Polyporus arcularius HHB13444 TaxID=1314778 RepID=A0A5C3P1X9_9APHY|nr:hypothetical protein K466DRAFT_602681 [Polyporus arcularius HHB13444]